LTNGFFGLVPKLAEHGIMYEASITQFYQGVASGGAEQRFRYGDKIDQYFIFDTEKLGLWKGGKLIMHGDTNLGQNSITDAAAFAPVNTAMLLPLPEPVTAITHFQYEQELGHGWAATVGKFNFLDLWQVMYPNTGRGLEGFMNTSILAPLNVVPSLPIVFDAAGVMKVGERGLETVVMAIDTRNTQTVSGLDGLFENGVTIFAGQTFFTEFAGLPGSHAFFGTYATGEFTSFEPSGWIVTPAGAPLLAPFLSEKDGAWLGAYVLNQKLWMDPCSEKRNINLFGYAGFSDPDTSPYEWTIAASVEAFGLCRAREHDRMGIGYFYSGVSSTLKNDLALLGLQDLQGGEVYYNAEITPWFHLTADLQVIQTENSRQDTALAVGLRGKIDL